MFIVVAALIKKDNKILLGRRASGDALSYDKWEFPGGKKDYDEDEFIAVEREIEEEFNTKVKAIKYIDKVVYKYPKKIVDLRLYECEYISGEFDLIDHSEISWVAFEDIKNYDLCPADRALYDKLVSKGYKV
ncbi:MAG: (deoxy)nucleoside triphosphate pyrophosphohydrolase [Mollicutes bacterium]|nr:(deoxy)nucleoside triphosphate pyrophosphohydrolase [Mollicutes bacterium]